MFLLLAVISNILINVIFRYFSHWKVDQFPAIVVNYLVCMVIGYLIQGNQLFDYDFEHTEKTAFILATGSMFIVGFNVVAATVRFFGIAFSTIMQKISLVLTALFGILIFEESSSTLKWIGILLAVAAILFMNRKAFQSNDKTSLPWFIYLLPIATLGVNTIIDCTFLVMDKRSIYSGSDLRLVTYIFTVAAILGVIKLGVGVIRNQNIVTGREIKAGILLGLVNYGSIYFLLFALSQGWEGSVFYPILNTSILLGATLIGILVFKEAFGLYKIIGFVLAIASILLVLLS